MASSFIEEEDQTSATVIQSNKMVLSLIGAFSELSRLGLVSSKVVSTSFAILFLATMREQYSTGDIMALRSDVLWVTFNS